MPKMLLQKSKYFTFRGNGTATDTQTKLYFVPKKIHMSRTPSQLFITRFVGHVFVLENNFSLVYTEK